MRFLSNLIIYAFLINSCSSSSTTEKAEKDKPVVYKEVEPSQAYESCKIGGQTWMAQNLNEPHFKNGDPIAEAKSADEWKKAGSTGKPAWCYYNNDPKLGQKFGKLYNWYAVNDPRGLAPKGWSVATNKNWEELLAELKKQDKDAMALQHASFIGNYPDADALQFHAYGSGFRKESGGFKGIDTYASFWTADTANAYSAYALHLKKDRFNPLLGASYKTFAFSVRCIKN